MPVSSVFLSFLRHKMSCSWISLCEKGAQEGTKKHESHAQRMRHDDALCMRRGIYDTTKADFFD